MRLLRKLFFLQKLYGSRAIGGTVVAQGVVAMMYGFVAAVVLADNWWLAAAVLAALLYVSGRVALQAKLINRILESRKYLSILPDEVSQASESAISNTADREHMNLITKGPGWSLFDMMLYDYDQDKSVRRSWRYTVFEAKLARITPHLIFDAKQAKGRQFRFIYANAQRVSLEGDFDRYFDTYAPDHYVIDTLSFVSPEVMQALLAVKDFDVELVNGHVLLYASFLDNEDLESFQQLSTQLVMELNDNLARYRDSYLPSRAARKHVLPFARKLEVNPWHRNWPGLAIGSLATAVAIGIGMTGHSEVYLNPYAILGYGVLVVSLARLIRAYRRNRQLRKSFYEDLEAVQTRGRY